MKYLAVFLLFHILLLSSVSGMGSMHRKIASCCIENTHTVNCNHQKHTNTHDCPKGDCNAMVPCHDFRFILTPYGPIEPAVTDLSKQRMPAIKIGRLSDYYDIDWNPPKA